MDYHITEYCKCSCGAITFYTEDGSGYSCRQSNVKRFFPGLDLRSLRKGRLPECYSCNHCVNHYGLDLCACGSGEPFEKCHNGFKECGKPMQVFGKYEHIRATDAWIC